MSERLTWLDRLTEWIPVPELLSLHFRRYFLSVRVLTLMKLFFSFLFARLEAFAGIGRRRRRRHVPAAPVTTVSPGGDAA
jgi:hypothetical protein